VERPAIPAAISHIAIPPAASAPRWPQRDGGRAARSVQYRLEAEHAQREEAHRRRVDFERRAQGYMEFTPSGRPYDSLPVISLNDVKELYTANKINLSGAIRNSCAAAAGR